MSHARQILHWFRANVGPIRVDTLGALRLCFGLMACAVAALVFMRVALRFDVPVGGQAQRNLFLAAAFLYAIPSLVGALELGRGASTLKLLQSAPVSKLQVVTAKVLDRYWRLR